MRPCSESFERAMDDDLNTAQALAAIFDWVRDLNTARAEGTILEDDRSAALSVMHRINEVLILWRPPEGSPDEKIRQLIEERQPGTEGQKFCPR